MIRDGILKTKRYELGDCRANHARKLRELFFATVNLTGSLPPYRPAGGSHSDGASRISEEDFLIANDLSKDRPFDLNTLRLVGNELATLPLPSPSITSEATTPSPVEDEPRQADAARAGDEAGARGPVSQASTPKEDEDELSSTQRSSRSTQPGTPATRETISGAEEHGADTAAAKARDRAKEDSVEQDDGDVSMVDVDGAAGQDVDRAPSSVVVTSRQDRPEISVDTVSKSQPISPPFDTEHAEGSSLKPTPGSTQPVQVPASPATPITPDAQLHLEASRAAKSSDVPTGESQQTSLKPTSGADAAAEGPMSDRPLIKLESRNLGDNMGESKLAARRRGLSPDLKNNALTREASKDLFLSQRPPMRIDTSISQHRNEAQTPASATPSKPSQSAIQTSPPERMTTRVSSGVLRHKSVSEILGETPRSAITPHADKTPTERTRHASHGDEPASHQPLIAAHLASSPDSTTFRSRLQELKEKEKDRTKLSTVVFARSQPGGRDGPRSAQADRERAPEKNKDYLVTLFTAQASAQVPTLDHLVKSAHKTLSTRDHYVGYREAQDCRILKRIYHLQNSNRWSLRQLERSVEPERRPSHWDNLLAEMKWMRSDFKEERKWQITMSRNLAEWCAEWVTCPVEQRSALQVKVRKPSSSLQPPENHITPVSLHVDAGCAISDTPPELEPSADDDPSDEADEELPRLDLAHMAAPATLFSLTPEDVVFDLERTPASDKILSELPMYQPFEGPRGVKRSHTQMMDRSWKKPIVPVSKFATGRLVLPDRKPARKRSRYEYADDAEDADTLDQPLMPAERTSTPLSPEQHDVALFNPENQHIIDRLHTAHAFRPPSEFPMPSQSFFECRLPSQWTLAEDDQLRGLVKEYEYNWSLISSCLSSPSLFSSGAERRTPWECFERWVSFEGLPGDMARHQYFRAWNTRRDAARQHLEQLAQNPQPGPGGQILARRRSSEPMGVERRRNSKYLALLMAMSKVAKKRETAIQRQQHVASNAAMRKATEPTLPRQRSQTPREMSALRYKADCERRELYRQQLAASQRVAMAQKAVQQATHAQAAAGGLPPSRNGRPPSMGGAQPQMSSLAQNGLSAGQRPMSSSQPVMNGMLPNGAQLPGGQLGVRGGNSVPQAQMQAYLQGQARLQQTQNGPDNARVIMEASRVSEQQRLMQQQRQYQAQANGLNSVPSSQHLAASMGIPMPSNAALMASAQGANGKLSPVGGLSASQPVPRPSSSSPRGPNATPVQHHPGQLSSGMVPVLNQISSHLKAMHPQASPEQIKQWATANLNNSLRAHTQHQHQQQQLSQAAVAAGMGLNAGSGVGGMPQLSPQHQAAALAYSSSIMNPQLYAQYMRSQQASQQSRLGADGSAGMANGGGSERNSVRPESRGQTATPQQKSGSVMSGSSQSPPQMPQAQLNGSS